jgi:hypothetical protein
MIVTQDGRRHKDVSTLKMGDVFKTNRNGTLPWSRWFKATQDPIYRMHSIPVKGKRWCLEGSEILKIK